MLLDKLRFTPENDDHPAVPMIKNLLNRTPSKRGTPASIKNHDWFKTMDWEELYYRALQPPFTPTMEPIDLSNPMQGSIQEVLLNDEQQEGPVRGKLHATKEGWDEDFQENAWARVLQNSSLARKMVTGSAVPTTSTLFGIGNIK